VFCIGLGENESARTPFATNATKASKRSLFAVHLTHFSLFTFQMRSDPGLNSSLTMADEKFHHSVYVILLDPVTLGLPSIVRLIQTGTQRNRASMLT